MERIFNDADNVAMVSLVSSTQLPAVPGAATQSAQASNAAVSMFDDDLDMGAPLTVAGIKRCSVCLALTVYIQTCTFMPLAKA